MKNLACLGLLLSVAMAGCSASTPQSQWRYDCWAGEMLIYSGVAIKVYPGSSVRAWMFLKADGTWAMVSGTCVVVEEPLR